MGAWHDFSKFINAVKGEIEFNNLRVTILDFHLKPSRNIVLPDFKEAAFRGAFGSVFKRMVCASLRREKCRDCMLFNKCAFSIIFSPGASEDEKFFGRFEAVPRPFTLRVLNKEKNVSVEDELKIQLLLVGRAAEYFPYIFLAIEELGREGLGIRDEEGIRGKYEINAVFERLPDGTRRNIYNSLTPSKRLSLCGFAINEAIDRIDSINECGIKLQTPLRLKKDGRIAQFIDFSLLVRSIITRVNALSYFYGSGSVLLEIRDLLEEAEKVNVCRCNTRFVDYKYHSGRQRRSIMLGGLVGEIVYRGNITPFYQFLKMAEILGVGKNTTFGFGQIRLQNIR